MKTFFLVIAMILCLCAWNLVSAKAADPDPTRPTGYQRTKSATTQSAPAPRSRLQLNAIFYSSQACKAVINGTTLTTGETIKGARVLSISPTEVVLKDRYGRRTLKLRSHGIKQNVTTSTISEGAS